jgi:glutamine amidotransferase
VIGVVDYGMGNIRSVLNALEAAGAPATRVTSPADLGQAEKLILPGVGAFGDAMRLLAARGLDEGLVARVGAGIPLLGICLGMQLLADRSLEHGEHIGLGLLRGTVRRIATQPGLRVPHVGWNVVDRRRPSRLLDDADEAPTFYFVHSFELQPEDPEVATGTSPYGTDLTAVVELDGVMGSQFHPEKSQADGLAFLQRFLAL